MVSTSTILIFVTIVTSVHGQNECQCDGSVVWPTGHKQVFETFEQRFSDSCTDTTTTCETSCNNYLSSKTENYELRATYAGTTLGDYICRRLENDAPIGSYILFESKGCDGRFHNVHQIDNFCCTSGNAICE